MTVVDIMKEWLAAHPEYDGLVHPEICGCDKDDLAPCGEMNAEECSPGYWRPCDRPGECEFDCKDGDKHMVLGPRPTGGKL